MPMSKPLLVTTLMMISVSAYAVETRLQQFERELELARQVDEASVRCNVTVPKFKPSEVGSMIYFIETCKDPRPSVVPRRRH